MNGHGNREKKAILSNKNNIKRVKNTTNNNNKNILKNRKIGTVKFLKTT